MYDNVDNDVVDDDDEDDENGEVDVGEEEDDEVEENDVEEEDRSQDREAHFVRACAGNMRMGISQEPFCMEIYWPGRMAADASGDIVLCEPKCTGTEYKSNFVWKFARKTTGTPPETSFCARLCSRNGHQHFTRAICVEIYRENGKRPGDHLD